MKNRELEEMVSELYAKDIPADVIQNMVESQSEDPDFDVIGEDSTENTFFSQEMKREVHLAVLELPELERQVITYYYGLDGKDRRSLTEITKMLHSTYDTVRDAKDRGLRMLRHPKRTQKLRPYLEDLDRGIIK